LSANLSDVNVSKSPLSQSTSIVMPARSGGCPWNQGLLAVPEGTMEITFGFGGSGGFGLSVSPPVPPLSPQDTNASAKRLKMTRPPLNNERRLSRFSFKAFIKYSP